MEKLPSTQLERWSCELHCHTAYSWDCDISVKRLVEYCLIRQIKVLAVTDHNQIDGALEAQRLAPPELKVIIGEEIATQQGHLIGLFLTELIQPHLSVQETIAAIRRQGGLVLVPHPFDRLRGGLGRTALQAIKGQIDFIEVFNSRIIFPADNVKALQFAQINRLSGYVGSDAHTRTEYGNALSLIEPFGSTEEFRQSLRRAAFTTKLSGPWVYAVSELVKWKKRSSRK